MVRIVTDSAADFSPAELEQKNIICIPLKVLFGGEEYEENINLSKDQFYEKLLAFEGFPKTSQAAPAVLAGLFEEAKAEGDEIIYFTLSSALSGTWQSAMFIKEDMGYDKAFVVDSRNATGGQRMLVEPAVRLRDQGKCAADIVAEVEALRERIVLYACINTLEYLYRGGRISQTVYKLGTLAQVKPIIRVSDEGKVEVPAKAMGIKKGMDYLCKRVEERKPDPNFPFYAMYTGDRSNGEKLAEKFRSMGYEIPQERIINVGAAIGSHVGPNACGMVYISE